MQSCARKIHFCFGHRVMGHENKCATLHGHNAIVWVHATPLEDRLDSIGRVVDFSVLKEKIGGWVDEHWDHTMILYKEDRQVIDTLAKVPASKPYFILDRNPTAENLAHHLLWEVCPRVLKGTGALVHKITFGETENCTAEESVDPRDPELLKRYRS